MASSLLRSEIGNALMQRRELSASSLKTYVSLLYSLYNKLSKEEERGRQHVVDFFTSRAVDIVPAIQHAYKSMQTQATLYSALWVLTGNPMYQSCLSERSNAVRAAYREQIPPPPMEDTGVEIMEYTHGALLLKAQQESTHLNITNAIIAGLYAGQYPGLPPRRLQDYANMKKQNYDLDSDNCYALKEDGHYEFVFNEYKTAKWANGPVILRVPDVLERLIDALGPSESDYLLTTTTGSKFSVSALHNRLKSLFGFGVDKLRSYYLSDMYKGIPKLTQMEDTAQAMGHSIGAQMLFYVKK